MREHHKRESASGPGKRLQVGRILGVLEDEIMFRSRQPLWCSGLLDSSKFWTLLFLVNRHRTQLTLLQALFNIRPMMLRSTIARLSQDQNLETWP